MSVTRSPAVTARASTEMSSAALRPTIDPPRTTPVAEIIDGTVAGFEATLAALAQRYLTVAPATAT